MTTTDESKAARQAAEDRLAALTADLEAKALEQTRTLLESPQPVVVPWHEYPQFDGFGQWPTAHDRPYYWTDVGDRDEGRYLPYYETDQDLRRMRADARRMRALFPVAEGALESLTNYVIGPGFEFTVQQEQDGAEDLVAMVQAEVDRILDHNDFVGLLDREIHEESRVDGEAFCTLYEEDENVRIELTSPDHIQEPFETRDLERWLKMGHKLNHWWHGVHTTWNPQLKRDDCCRPHGYNAVYDHLGDQWDYLPASRVEHIKRNVGRKGRRGISDYDLVLQDLEHEGKIRRNTAVGAAILAAIVLIRQHAEGVGKSAVETLVGNSATSNYDKRIKDGQRTTQVENVRPGTVKDIPHGMQAQVGPLGQLRSPVYIEVAQYLLRIIGVRWNTPEYLISGDASNANYASTLVAESPFVRARQADQRKYGRHYERILWKALRIRHAAGAFGRVTWAQIVRTVSIKVEHPSVESTDDNAEATRNEVLHRNGVMSRRTWATAAGLDYDEERQEIAQEPAPAMGAGMPGIAFRSESQRREFARQLMFEGYP